ncbi:MAG: hypothetical protein V3V09_02960, partial [Arenicellales bacterium]
LLLPQAMMLKISNTSKRTVIASKVRQSLYSYIYRHEVSTLAKYHPRLASSAVFPYNNNSTSPC